MARSLLRQASSINLDTNIVLPVPVAPVAKMIESLKKPPPHISSSRGTPELTRTLDERWVSRIAPSGKILMPWAPIVKGNSPFICVVPRNLRISTVRRRRSPSSTLRRITTLSETNSSTPYRAIGPYSSMRSVVITVVTPISFSRAIRRKISRRTTKTASYCWKTAVIESITTRFALYLRIA